MAHGQEAAPQLVIDRLPFDRVTLNTANDNLAIDVQLLNLPERTVPTPLPTDGSLSLRRLSDPSNLYDVSWTDISKIELYEQLILNEARDLITGNRLKDAYRNLEFLYKNYSQLEGLKEVSEIYLQRDALAAFQAKRYDESFAILAALYDINPQRQGLAKAIEGVSDRLIEDRLANRDFAAARAMLESLRTSFPRLALTNLPQWQQRFAVGAQRQLDFARQAMATGNYSAAREAVRRANAILPNVEGSQEIFDSLRQLAPQIAVGVGQLASSADANTLRDWAHERVGRLTTPQFVELTAVGREGGEYSCRWADLKQDPDGMRLTIRLNQQAINAGINPDTVARQLLQMANPHSEQYRVDFASVFSRVNIIEGQSIVVDWKFPYLKPITFLRFPISSLDPIQLSTISYAGQIEAAEREVRFQVQSSAPRDSLPAIVEKRFDTEEEAEAAFDRGDVEVLDNLAPWQISRIEQIPGVVMEKYALPTIHVLLCNFDNPLMKRREFRRALCYGIDRARIVSEVLGGGKISSGIRALSGPLPAGITVNDSIGYAYKQELAPLPYEPRLAAVLANAARVSIAKQPQGVGKTEVQSPSTEETVLPVPITLKLVHPGDSVARTVCQLIARQLEVIGIPVELKVEGADDDTTWDLRYTELCIDEPLVDARRLLGPGGLAGRCSPTMDLALRELDHSVNWNEARSRLQRIHQIAYDDLPVISLWQTVNQFAYRRSLAGVTQAPVSLYQNVGQWQITLGTVAQP